MKNWHALFELLSFPIAIIFIGTMMIGTGNLLTNPIFHIAQWVNNETVSRIAELILRTGQFIVVNFPLLFLIRLVSRKNASATTVISGFFGYVIFLFTTLFFTSTTLNSTAYSSILGMGITKSTIGTLSNGAHYPLQAGVFGCVIVSIITLVSFQRSRNRNAYGIFSFLSKEMICTIRTIFYCLLAGIGFAYGWPYVLAGLERIIRFISVDTTNPVNLSLFGILDRVLSACNLSALIRQPFWYASQGGSWVDFGGNSIVGDVNIWTQQFAANAMNGIVGRFITPYYVLNLFAIPGMIWGMYSMETSPIEKRKIRMLCIIGTIVSMMTGNLLAIEFTLLFLCPLLYVFHLAFTGILFGLLQGLHVYLGYNTMDTTTITAMPGTLPELLTYLRIPSLQKNIMIIVLIGILFMILYFVTTRVYFKFLAIDWFKTDARDRIVTKTLKALGGVENVKMTQSSISSLTVALYNPEKIDINRLKRIGAYRIFESKAGYTICFGAGSTMIRTGIEEVRRDNIRDVQ